MILPAKNNFVTSVNKRQTPLLSIWEGNPQGKPTENIRLLTRRRCSVYNDCVVEIYMNSASNYVRVNVSLPRDLLRELKEKVPFRGISSFLSDAAREKIAEKEKIVAFKELLDAPPAFTFLKGKNAVVNWVRKSRRKDENRLKRIWGGHV